MEEINDLINSLTQGIEVPTNEYNESMEEKIEQLRNDPNDVMHVFYNQYPKVSEMEMFREGHIKDETVIPMVRHAYCPNCGKELISNSPLLLNPYTGERIAKHECTCGYKANLDYAYPRMYFVDNNGDEVMAYSR